MSTPDNRKAILFSEYRQQRTIIQGDALGPRYVNFPRKFLGNYLYCVGMDHVLIICRHDLVNWADVFGTDV